jgi:hypothetical protein
MRHSCHVVPDRIPCRVGSGHKTPNPPNTATVGYRAANERLNGVSARPACPSARPHHTTCMRCCRRWHTVTSGPTAAQRGVATIRFDRVRWVRPGGEYCSGTSTRAVLAPKYRSNATDRPQPCASLHARPRGSVRVLVVRHRSRIRPRPLGLLWLRPGGRLHWECSAVQCLHAAAGSSSRLAMHSRSGYRTN